MLIISVFVGFFVSLGLPFFLEFLDHRVKTANDVENILSLPVICSISDIKN
jgi:capsular polysaccharide biosynthesis protein